VGQELVFFDTDGKEFQMKDKTEKHFCGDNFYENEE
jgi:hypothetical protein